MLRGLFFTLTLWAVGAATLRVTMLSPHLCPAVTADSALATASLSATWIETAQKPDGSFVYEYNRSNDSESSLYNVVRHAGVTLSLYELAARTGDATALAAGDRALRFEIANLYYHGDWVAFSDPADGGLQLGAGALMLAGLLQRRIATSDPQYDELSRLLARGLVALQLPDGAFLDHWDRFTDAPDLSQRSKYATGEAFWALTLMHRLFPGEGWDVHARKTADYLSTSRDAYEHQKFPPWADQWASYGLAEMATSGWGLSDANIAYARTLADRFGFLIRVESQRRDNWFSRILHGRQARAAGMGTWVEGLGSMYRIASADPRMADMAPKLKERLACGAGMLVARQVDAQRSQHAEAPGKVLGAWFTNDITRMDDQQHALSAVLFAAPVLPKGRND
jgi:hypothetical protein